MSDLANVVALARCHWRAYWRRFGREGSLSLGNQGIVLLILGVVFVKYLQLLHALSVGLTNGKTSVLQSLLAGIFVAWLFPLASGRSERASAERLLHLPLSLSQLFAVRLISLFNPPPAWLIAVGSLAICYPLLSAPNPVGGIVAALLFIATSWQVGVSLAQLVSVANWRRGFVGVFLAVLLGATFYLLRGPDSPSLAALRHYNPRLLVVNAALGNHALRAIGVLSILLLVASSLAVWSFRQSLRTTTRSSRQRLLPALRIPGRFSGLVAKDLRYFRRLLDRYFGVLACILCGIHLVLATAPSADVVRIAILLVFVGNSSIAFNLFGLDSRSGLERYALMPLSGTATLLSKNVAFALLVSGQLFPVLILAGWRLGLSVSGGGFIEALSLASGYLACGNWMSVRHPIRLQFYRFSSSGAALADSIGGLIFGSVPGVVAIYCLRENAGAGWIVLPVTLVFIGLYAASIFKFGKRFERRREEIAVALS